jgi:hypothetical protein
LPGDGEVRIWVNRVVSAMSAVSPLYPQEPTSSVRPATSEKCGNQNPTFIALPQ